MKEIILAFIIVVAASDIKAQHNHHQKDTLPERDTASVPAKTHDTDHSQHSQAHSTSVPMSHSFSLNLPMTRNGSGTGWLPDAAPMFGYMKHSEKWMYMFHGSAFLRYNKQDFSNMGTRGGEKVDAPNWFMAMGQRRVGRNGLFHFSGMFSLDPIIAGGSGYPLLFQTGESYKGVALVDRQHPHDLISELSISYALALSEKVDLFAYVGYPGEPALGPVTFMHRPSSLDNPNAPITHHWVDATHITFGVATLGIRAGKFKLEGSSFTGREPNENRYDFDKPGFNSWSGRLSANPTRNWSLQISHGYIKSPELLHPGENVHKSTASAIYNSDVQSNRYFSATGLWGMNKFKSRKGENALLLEAAWHLNSIAVYGRHEFAEKSAEELILDENEYGHHTLYDISALTMGLNADVLKFSKTRLALGGNFSIHHAPKKLDNLYGSNPMSFQVYLRLYPELMNL